MRLNDLSKDVNVKNAFIAGGAVLSSVMKTEINDYDIYPKRKEDIEEILTYLIEDNCYISNISDRAVTLISNGILKKNGERSTVQVMILGECPTPDSIFSKFDFTCCMGAFDLDTKEYHFHKDFYPDVSSRTLRFNPQTHFPLSSLLRTTKYREKGFYIPKSELIKIAFAIGEKGLPKSWGELESQIGGTYGKQISIKNKDKEFSMETVYEYLDENIDFTENLVDRAGEFSTLNIESVMDIVLKRKVTCVKACPQDNSFYTKHEFYRVDEKGFIGDAVGSVSDKIEIDSEQTLYGYKSLFLHEGKYYPSIQGLRSKVTYKIGEETEYLESPYIFLWKDKNNFQSNRYDPKNTVNKLYLVSFKAKDIISLSNDQLQVKKLKVIEEVERT